MLIEYTQAHIAMYLATYGKLMAMSVNIFWAHANSFYIRKRRTRWFLNIVWCRNYESLALAFLLCGWFSPVLPAINKLTWQQPINVWINVHGWLLPFQFPPGSIAQELIYLLISTLLSLWSKETHVDCWDFDLLVSPRPPWLHSRHILAVWYQRQMVTGRFIICTPVRRLHILETFFRGKAWRAFSLFEWMCVYLGCFGSMLL